MWPRLAGPRKSSGGGTTSSPLGGASGSYYGRERGSGSNYSSERDDGNNHGRQSGSGNDSISAEERDGDNNTFPGGRNGGGPAYSDDLLRFAAAPVL